MKLISGLVLLVLAIAAPACAASDKPVAIQDPGLKGKGALAVSSSTFKSGGAIPDLYSSYGQGASPPLAWSGAPKTTQAFVLILQDPDAPTPRPFIHWLVWNIPGSARGLEQGALPAGAAQGKLMFVNKVGYMGPMPPPGPAHHYHFQLFALDQPLDLPAGAEIDALTGAMKGHVLASGELVGTYKKP
jgi:Raf kinase inhibitor-like YbhB/YbcL family protein